MRTVEWDLVITATSNQEHRDRKGTHASRVEQVAIVGNCGIWQ
jgi:hypothetical protein